jgi:hypothetical protein
MINWEVLERKLLSLHFPERTEENYEKSGVSTSNSRAQVRSVIVTQPCTETRELPMSPYQGSARENSWEPST